MHQCLQRKEPLTQYKKDVSELIILAVYSGYSRQPVVVVSLQRRLRKCETRWKTFTMATSLQAHSR